MDLNSLINKIMESRVGSIFTRERTSLTYNTKYKEPGRTISINGRVQQNEGAVHDVTIRLDFHDSTVDVTDEHHPVPYGTCTVTKIVDEKETGGLEFASSLDDVDGFISFLNQVLT